jgi:hypothetical protein
VKSRARAGARLSETSVMTSKTLSRRLRRQAKLMRFIVILLLVKLGFVAGAVSGAPLITLKYEGVSGAEKCSYQRDFFSVRFGKILFSCLVS